MINGVILLSLSFYLSSFCICIWTLKCAVFKCSLIPENKKVKLIFNAVCLAFIGARAVHKLLMFALCCSLLLLIMWISEAPVQQHLPLQLKLHPCCLRLFQILPWIDHGEQCWRVLAIVLPIFSSEGRNVFITENWIWFCENNPCYFKHFKLFGCSVYNSGVLGRLAWGIILGYASSLRDYWHLREEIFIDRAEEWAGLGILYSRQHVRP